MSVSRALAPCCKEETHKSIVGATSDSDQKAFIAKAWDVNKSAISPLREGSSILEATFGDVPKHTVCARRLSILQRLDSIVAVTGKCKFQQALQVNPRNLIAPALGSEIIKMTSKVPSPA